MTDAGATVSIRSARRSDAAAIGALIRGFADRLVDDVDSSSAASFLQTFSDQAVSDRLGSDAFRTLVAESNGAVCGVLVVRDDSHLYHLFVRADMQRQRIARRLWQAANRLTGSHISTVNASLGSVEVYRRFGFSSDGPPITKKGVTFVPMRLATNNRTDQT